MDTQSILTLIIAAASLLLLGVLVAVTVRRRRRLSEREAAIRDEFGEEYDRLRADTSRSKAIEQLERSAERLGGVRADRIGPDDRAAFTERWHEIQRAFLDAPSDSIRRADELVTDVLRARNLPVGSVEERMRTVASLDDDGSTAVELREAHELFVELESDDTDDLATADLRGAMLVFQRAFEVVLDRPESEHDLRVDRRPSEPVRTG